MEPLLRNSCATTLEAVYQRQRCCLPSKSFCDKVRSSPGKSLPDEFPYPLTLFCLSCLFSLFFSNASSRMHSNSSLDWQLARLIGCLDQPPLKRHQQQKTNVGFLLRPNELATSETLILEGFFLVPFGDCPLFWCKDENPKGHRSELGVQSWAVHFQATHFFCFVKWKNPTTKPT